ncbi:hypothetical protein HC891_06650 [Candidatus Gracilibacteria bacterium]|nr:hypothetical protein [Candidatus Gracilibacteria bacterium]
MHILQRLTRYVRMFAALSVLSMGAIAPTLPSNAQSNGLRVYLLRGGDKPADDAVSVALREAGFDVIEGVESHQFDGTQADLRAYNTIVLLHTKNWQQALNSDGIRAISDYVANGGGLVTGERVIAEGEFVDIAPASSCGTSKADATEYQQFSVEPMINDGLPLNFSLNLASYGGSSETCFDVKSTASVFYISSNGGGKVGSPGLVGWRSGNGRVASFSTMVSDSELANRDYRRLLQNTVRWAARPHDSTPPVITRMVITDSGQMTDKRTVSIDLAAADDSGASGTTIWPSSSSMAIGRRLDGISCSVAAGSLTGRTPRTTMTMMGAVTMAASPGH